MQNDGCTLIDCFAGAESARPSAVAPGPAPRAAAPRYKSQPSWGGTRRFESADTTRLNQAHWLWADEQSVNVWLSSQLATIRARAAYERRQNPTIQGIVNDYCNEVVGPAGPILQIISDDEDFNAWGERQWRDWIAAPTTDPNVSGASWLKAELRSCWDNGELLDVIVDDRQASGPVRMRLRPLRPHRLSTPPNLAGDPNVLLGIRFNGLARPMQYYIDAGPVEGGSRATLANYQPFPPDMVIHHFVREEQDQARGIPWLNWSLSPAADLRDYDDQVQDAARNQADNAMLLYADDPGMANLLTPEWMNVERRTIKTLPPGWKPSMYQATQPPAQYVDYRTERQRDLGRAKGLPLLIIRRDASRHTYSSARFDALGFDAMIQSDQQWLSGGEQNVGPLSRLCNLVLREAELSDPPPRRRPERISFLWIWPRRPHVDRAKEGTGDAIDMQNMTLSWTDALAAHQTTPEQQIAKLKREMRLLVEAGLPVPAEWIKHPSAILAEAIASKDPSEEETIEN